MSDDKGNSNLEQKEKHYANLVKRRKKCYKCKDKGMINPSRHELAKYDEVHAARDHINPWSRWQHGLNADVLLVGQDWGTKEFFVKYKGQDPAKKYCPTNDKICELFKTLNQNYRIGIDGYHVDYTLSDSRLFFTNIVQCLKKGQMSSPLSSEVARVCAEEFIRELIEIIKPKVIIALGNKAFQSLVKLYSISAPSSLREIFLPEGGYKNEYMAGFALPAMTSKLFPVYHCGPLGIANRGPVGLTKNERFELQKKDWVDIRNYLTKRA